MKKFLSKITPVKASKVFFDYLAPFAIAAGATIFFLFMQIPSSADAQAEKRKQEGDAIYCSRMVKTETVDADGFTEYRCFKDEK